jgi:hypothetical protein
LHASGRTERVVIALEYPSSEQDVLDSFAGSNGDEDAKRMLLESPFWSRPEQDGRSSEAVFQLVDGLRLLSQEAGKIELVAIASQSPDDIPRRLDDLAAANVDAVVVALMGNYHARRARLDLGVEFLTFAFRPHSGQYWACKQSCEIQTLLDNPDAAVEARLDLANPMQSENYHGLVDIGVVTPALPVTGARP